MAMELKHLNPQHVMDVTGKAIDEISRLRVENAELKEKYKDMDITHTVHIAKMNARIEELESALESEKASRDAESVDAGMRERRIKRALWLRRVETAKIEIRYWRERLFNESSTTRAGIHGQRLIPQKTFRTIREWLTIWDNVERKCLAKAEEFK